MRAFVREKIDLSKEIDISKLNKIDSLKVSIRYAFSKSSFAKRQRQKLENEILEERMRRINDLRKITLYRVNKILAQDSKYNKVSVLIDRSNEDILHETLDSSDFISYNIEYVKESPDFLLSFPNLPIKVIFSRRRLDEIWLEEN